MKIEIDYLTKKDNIAYDNRKIFICEDELSAINELIKYTRDKGYALTEIISFINLSY